MNRRLVLYCALNSTKSEVTQKRRRENPKDTYTFPVGRECSYTFLAKDSCAIDDIDDSVPKMTNRLQAIAARLELRKRDLPVYAINRRVSWTD